MRAVRWRATGVAAAAATGAVLLAAAAAQAQDPPTFPEKTGNGAKTGQIGVQLFNYGGFISNGGGLGSTPPALGVSAECATATSTACRWERLDKLFGFLKSKGVTNVELFGHAGFPSTAQTDPADQFGLHAYRALLEKHGLHAGGWHGSMNEAQWDARTNAAKILGADYIGSGGVADPGINSYDAVLRSAQALNRLGKRSVEAGVGPAYIHNHEQEFDRKYVDNGELKSTYDILMERTDPRYVVGELDVFWSSDAFNDTSGEQSAAFINKWGSRIQMLHIKDGINAGLNGASSSRAGSPRAFGTGEIDFRPIFAAAANKVRYYHQEQDGGTLTDADVSLTNLKGRGPQAVPALHAKPPSFASVAAGTAAADNVTALLVTNKGDLPLAVTGVAVQGLGAGANQNQQPAPAPNDAADFQVVSQTCTGGAILPGGTCVVNVGFKPTKTNYTSLAQLRFTSNSDDATKVVLLAARSTGDALGSVGGDVGSILNLSVPAGGSFGTFVPGVARDYTTALAATVTATTGDAALSVLDASGVPGRLTNGAFSLATPLGIRALALGDSPATAYSALNTDGTPLVLRNWSGPTTNDGLTLGFRQAITANEPLRAGTYSKNLTFTLSTTTP